MLHMVRITSPLVVQMISRIPPGRRSLWARAAIDRVLAEPEALMFPDSPKSGDQTGLMISADQHLSLARWAPRHLAGISVSWLASGVLWTGYLLKVPVPPAKVRVVKAPVGVPRPKPGPQDKTTLRLPKPVMEQLRHMAGEAGISVPALIATFCKSATLNWCLSSASSGTMRGSTSSRET